MHESLNFLEQSILGNVSKLKVKKNLKLTYLHQTQ